MTETIAPNNVDDTDELYHLIFICCLVYVLCISTQSLPPIHTIYEMYSRTIGNTRTGCDIQPYFVYSACNGVVSSARSLLDQFENILQHIL